MSAAPRSSIHRLFVSFALLTLVIPVAGFLLAGDEIEQWIGTAIQTVDSPETVAIAIGAVLAVDLFLPVPSSVVLTYGGISLGILPATIAGCLGLMISSEVGYWLGRLSGRPIAKRFVSERELERAEHFTNRTSVWLLVISRPLPLLAEAATIGAGMTRVPHGIYALVIFVANFWVTLTFTTLGAYGGARYQWPVLIGSAVVPLAITWFVRSRLLKPQVTSTEPLSTEQPNNNSETSSSSAVVGETNLK